jgi:hypothetical protein
MASFLINPDDPIENRIRDALVEAQGKVISARMNGGQRALFNAIRNEERIKRELDYYLSLNEAQKVAAN